MEAEPKDLIVLGAIKHGVKKFDKIQKMTKIEPEELNLILEQLEKRGFIQAVEKKGLFGMKVEITVTDKGSNEVDERVPRITNKMESNVIVIQNRRQGQIKTRNGK